MNEGSHGTNVQPAGRWQDVLNESWSAPEFARRLNDRPAAEQIAVTVRVVFATGEERIEGMASRWTRGHVYVLVPDKRVRIGGVWVLARDVVRRDVTSDD